MQGNELFHWYSMLTDNANKQNISFHNLLNQMETGEYGIMFCNRKFNASLMHSFQLISPKFDVRVLLLYLRVAAVEIRYAYMLEK